MGGIAGAYFFDGDPVEKTDIEKMLNIIVHRGPDGSGIWTDGHIGLGHRMLWTTPESLHEKLPLSNRTRNLIITADARIDNRDELISTFNLQGRPSQTIADSELIVAAFERWGEGCLERFLGDFSFAIWDSRKNRLFCARDHMGVKPFYYYLSDRVFVFASEIKALLSIKAVPCQLNEKRVAEYLLFIDDKKTDTIYKDILRLAPGNCIQVEKGKVSLKTYWSLDPSKELKLSSDDEYAEAFHDLFSKSVQCRLRSSFPVGSMLSGGLDSSSIVCTARKLLLQNGKRNLHIFSGIFDKVKECDERHYIEAVLSQGGLIPHFYHTDSMNPLSNLSKMLYHEEEPFHAPNLYMSWGLYEIAKGLDIHVMLDGTDGDTTLAHSLIYLTELTRKMQWGTLYKEIKGLSEKSKRPSWKYLWQYSVKALAPEFIRKAWRNLHKREYGEIGWGILSPNFVKRSDMFLYLKSILNERKRALHNSRLAHHSLLTSGMVTRMLEVIDRATAAFSIEPRYPFFDKRLVEFCLSLPTNQKLYRGWSRIIMRRAMANILPEIVQWRVGKIDFFASFRQGLLDYGRESLEEVVGNKSKLIATYVNRNDLNERFQRFLLRGRFDDTYVVWESVVLAMWFDCAGIRF